MSLHWRHLVYSFFPERLTWIHLLPIKENLKIKEKTKKQNKQKNKCRYNAKVHRGTNVASCER